RNRPQHFEYRKRNPACSAAHGQHQPKRNADDHRRDEAAHHAEEAQIPALPIAFLTEHMQPRREHRRRRGNRADPWQVILLEAHHAEETLEWSEDLRREPLLAARANFAEEQKEKDGNDAAAEAPTRDEAREAA